jgi:NAD(P)-dependent dehydrogenase (short-subunit alcohol dehydrogenase family)
MQTSIDEVREALDAWHRVIAVNLNGVFYCNHAAVPHMERNSYGRIVNVASIAGKEGTRKRRPIAPRRRQ